jgi:hypothetical protein
VSGLLTSLIPVWSNLHARNTRWGEAKGMDTLGKLTVWRERQLPFGHSITFQGNNYYEVSFSDISKPAKIKGKVVHLDLGRNNHHTKSSEEGDSKNRLTKLFWSKGK